MIDTGITPLKKAWIIALKDLMEHPPTQDLLFWLGAVSFFKEENEKIAFSIKNQFIYKTFKSKEYDLLIERKLQQITGIPLLCEWLISEEESDRAKFSSSETSTFSYSQKVKNSENRQEDICLETKKGSPDIKLLTNSKEIRPNPTLNSKYTFENFVLGENNQFAYQTAMAISERPGKELNPCLIYGPVGLGKTHLMQSIGHALHQKNPQLTILYLTAETFLNEFQEALKSQEQYRFKNKYRYVDVLLIDDVHDLRNKEATQEELFHTFEALYNSNAQMVFTCDRPPKELNNFTERLKSRFERGVILSISEPDWETRLEILKRNLKSYQRIIPAHLDESILKFTAKMIKSNIRILESALKTLAQYNVSMKTEITTEIAHKLLKDFIDIKRSQMKNNEISLDDILKSVCDFYHLNPNDVLSHSRIQEISNARKVFIYLAREFTHCSTPQIGEYLDRHHSSVVNAEKSLKKEIAQKNSLREQVKALKQRIKEKELLS